MFEFLKRLFGKKASQPVVESAPVNELQPFNIPAQPAVTPTPVVEALTPEPQSVAEPVVVEAPAQPAAMTAKPKRERKPAKSKAEASASKKPRAKKSADVAWPFERPAEGPAKRNKKSAK